MKKKDKLHYFIHRVIYVIKLLNDLKISLLLLCACFSMFSAI